MKTLTLIAFVATACTARMAPVKNVPLGRVVVYRNGIAYFERSATLTSGTLEVAVPIEKVDDFLKSLMVRDTATGKSLPVSFPSRTATRSGMVNMTISLPPNVSTDVVLTYITEAPSWKPSYRIVVADNGEVELEGWAIVDNASGEDWRNVLVGVGSSSALSFRYDLWSVRTVARQTLSSDDRLAVAPPTGTSPYGQSADSAKNKRVVIELGDGQFNIPDTHRSTIDGVNTSGVSFSGSSSLENRYTAASGEAVLSSRKSRRSRDTAAARKERAKRQALMLAQRKAAESAQRHYAQNAANTRALAARVAAIGGKVIIEGFAAVGDKDAEASALRRANIVRNQLIENGVPPGQLGVRSAGAKAGRPAGVRLIAAEAAAATVSADESPVGESNFHSQVPISVPQGTSVMVSVVSSNTKGEVVYLYDAESSRGNSRFAFKAVRLDNPTNNTLEAGPVTVYGHERFIGEGLTDPVPPKSRALIPFALDRQVTVERKQTRANRIISLAALQRGVLTTRVAHSLLTDMTVTNRLRKPVTVYVRHAVTKGWTLDNAPDDIERIGNAYLIPVTLAARQTRSLHLQESTPLVKSLNLHSPESIAMVEAFVSRTGDSNALATTMKPVLALHRKLVDQRDTIASLRSRTSDYRARMNELEEQIVSLKEVKSGRKLLRHLETKMREISSRVQAATFEVVELQEQLMLTRIQLQDSIAEMTLDTSDDATATRSRLTPNS